jgi:hypothetical protein
MIFIICTHHLILLEQKTITMRWMKHVACMTKITNACIISAGKPEAKRMTQRWEDNKNGS